MEHLEVHQVLGLLVLVLAAAKLAGAAAKWIGQPAVLGELIAGVLLGMSVFGLVNPKNEIIHFLAEVGVVILLFEIGLETDVSQLLRVGGASAAVAVVGVVLPFALGYGVCQALGLDNLVAVVAGATLTATSVGITARVFSDLGRLREPESQIVLGAAVIDDLLGLIILAVVSGMTAGAGVTFLGVAGITTVAFGFLIVTLVLGSLIVPVLIRGTRRIDSPGLPTILAVAVAFGLAWLARIAGSAMIIGAFAAGLLLRRSSIAHQIEEGARHLGYLFVPIFFVVVGAAVDVSVFNPLNATNHQTLLVGGLLIIAAVVGKLAAGYAPFWLTARKTVIGVGMIPRGEVGLIFAQMGLSTGVFDTGLFSAVMLMVMATTFLAPPLLRLLFPPLPVAEPRGPGAPVDLAAKP
jgi:Kef-type K+ transport system membrane component KefB